jgi:hypothetical protein
MPCSGRPISYKELQALSHLRQANAVNEGLGEQEHDALNDEGVFSVQELVYFEATSVQSRNNTVVPLDNHTMKSRGLDSPFVGSEIHEFDLVEILSVLAHSFSKPRLLNISEVNQILASLNAELAAGGTPNIMLLQVGHFEFVIQTPSGRLGF